MNEEVLTTIQISLSGLGLCLASFLYSWAGRAAGPGKWVRRYLSSFVLAVTVNLICIWRGIWEWPMVFIYPLLIGTYSLGYGADDVRLKVFKRSLVVALSLMTGFLMVYCLGGRSWLVFLPHVGIGAFSIYMGVVNPIKAAAEEWSISIMLNLALILYPFI